MDANDAKPVEKKERAPRIKEDPVKKELDARLLGMKLFGKWDSNLEVTDPGLKRYVNLIPKMVPRTSGVNQKNQFHKSKMHIVERLALHVIVSGHASKKHKITSGKFGGGFQVAMKNVEHAFDIMEKKTGKNPVEILIKAIENAAMSEEIAAYQVGGTIARQAVITSPQRRIDKVLRLFAQGAYKDSFNKKTAIADALATELLNAYEGNNKSMAIREKERVEQEAAGAR